SGGGVLGGLVSTPFLMLFKPAGTIVILASMSLINIVLLTEISIAKSLLKLKDTLLRMPKRLAKKSQRNFSSHAELTFQDIEPKEQPETNLSECKLIDFNKEKES